MLTERTLKRYRSEALRLKEELEGWDHASERTMELRSLSDMVLKCTQELLDIHLLRKVKR